MKLARMAHLTIIIKRQFLDINGKKWCPDTSLIGQETDYRKFPYESILPIIQNLH